MCPSIREKIKWIIYERFDSPLGAGCDSVSVWKGYLSTPFQFHFVSTSLEKKINLSGYFEIVYIRHGERNSKISSPFKIYPLFLHFYFQTVAITRRDCLKGDLCSAHGKYKQLILTLVFTRLLSWYNYFRLNIGLEIIWNQLRILQHAASFFLLGPPTRFFPLSRSLKTFSILIKKKLERSCQVMSVIFY